MRWRLSAVAGTLSAMVAMVAVVAVPAAAGPPPDVPPAVSFSPTELTLEEGPSAPCSDAYLLGLARLPLLVDDPDGSSDGSPPLSVAYTTSGDAAPGVDYDPLPPTLDGDDVLRAGFGAGDAGYAVTLTIALQPGAGYQLGPNPTLTVTIEHLERRCEAPTFTDAPSNRAQTIRVGDRPAPLQLVDRAGGAAFAVLLEGRLPPGVELARDGSFTGAARSPGTFVATVGACRPGFFAPPGLCTPQQLRITVLGDELARTG